MKKPLLLILFFLVFVNYLSAQVSLTALNTAKSENFDGMTATGTSKVTGWSAVKASGTSAAATGSALTLAVYTTSSNSGAAYNAGTSGAADRSLGSLASGALVPRFGAGFQNNTGSTVTSIDLSGVMEQWRTGSNATVNENLNFEYSFNATGIADASATWLPLTGMALNEKLTTTTAAAGVDGNQPANQTAISGSITAITWVNGATLYIRWTDTDDLGSDGIYTVDDFSITPKGSATATPVLSASNTELVFGDQNINSNSTAQSYTLGGANLTANVSVNATAPFSVSKDNVTFSNAISYTTAEVAASPLVYVRFSPTAAGNASGNITNTSTGATPVNVAVSGNGLSTILTVNQTAFDFGSQNTGTNSTAQTFNLSATGLTDVVNVTTTAPFYLSKDNVTYSTSLVYSVAELTTGKTVYARFSPTAASTASGNISIASTGATTQNIATTGVGTTPPVAPTPIVISEVYGGGGNTGATYKNDFIELYNPGNTAVDLTGWSVQYAAAAGTSWQVTPLTGSIPAKSFYLVQEAAGTGGTINLPTPDVTGTINMSGTAFKIVLSNDTTALTGANPTGAAIVDKIGVGPTASGYETAATAVLSNTASAERKASATSTAATLAVGGTEEFNGNGYDTDNNSTDFVVTSPNPQNSTVKEPTGANHVVISEAYGGGGNSGAVYKNDFIELYNPTLSAVDLTGWSVQYASATGTGNWTVTTLSGSIAPKGFYLIQQSAGTGGTTNLPTPDKIGTIAMSGTAGKVLLSNSITAQTGSLPTGATVIDLVGFGATANGFEGTAPAPAPSNTSSIERKASATSDATTLGTGGTEEFAGNGYDSDDNAADFIVRTPNPQNSSVTEPVSTSGPYLVVTPKTLAFSNQAINTTSAAKTYVLSAGNLTNNTTLTVTGPFSISKDNTTFANTLSYTVADLATNQTVYVKFSPTAVGNANGAIVHASAGATSVSLALSGPAIDPNQTAFNFENCTTVGSAALSDGFYQYSVTGPQTWGCTTTFGHDASDPTGAGSGGNAVQINGYSGGNILNEDWLISPTLNISSFNYAILSFWTRSAFAGDKLQLKISTNYTGSGNPGLATWTSLDGKFPETGSDKWTKSDNIDLSAYKAIPVYVAIVYNSTTSSASRWTVDDFAVTNSNTPPAVDITTSPSSISFGFQAANTTSAANTFGFSAGNLTGDVTLTAPANFTLSKTSTGTYSSSITYPKADINNTSPTVYAKFSPTAVNTSYTGNVNIATSGSANKTVALSGNTFDIANTLEVVNWNIEWFGSPAQDPSNDALQAANVKTVVNNINADIYGFAEVVDTTLFRNTVLPAGYNVVFSEFGSYADNKADADYPLAQKLAFMYRTDLIKPISTLGILRDTYNPAVPATSADGTPYKNWSSGRFPYMMQAQVKINNKLDTVYFVEIHAKANTGTTADQIDSYNRRKNGNKQLKDWLDANLAGKKVIILGDFNDVLDADKTIAPMPAGTGTSYSDFTQDAANYFPVTLPLSLAGKQSTAGFNTVIDNVIITKSLNLNYIPASAEVLDGVKNLVTNYSSTTTDHYPIKTRYLFGNGAPTLDAVADQAVCYTSANQTIALTGISAGPETAQNTTLAVTSDNANLFDVLTVAANGADKGTITYHLKNNVSGAANITVTVIDNGGTDFGGVDKTTKTFKLTVTSTATATVTGTAAVCINGAPQSIIFTGANGTAPYTFTYNINGGASQTVSTSATSASVTVSAPTNVAGTFAYHLVNVKDANCGQTQTGSATITVNALPVVSISSNKGLSVSKGDAIVLTATGGTQFSWTGADILSGQNTAALTIRPKQSGTYRVTIANASGCVSDQNIAITVIEDYKLEASTVITPNGDGYNDKFIVKNIDYYPNNTLKIFDKAGRILYTKHTYANDWDGTINGSPLNEGTYYYIIDLGNGIGTFKGYINIIRD
ncbi:gliding motility-associated C-terminal domain-containing protein [Pedobacter terrae]|uniref:Gliding motility-associated C-terminal domain-containing protein n=1 Tax=Pedobacter terrae TaxID=405671 RepID=A0A1G7PQN6_9SPHI|nr:lamin tail domain-containing protein [Pedobacter terrae]SDF88642.1 gliding motility-associated C-terminal domain-containing protein [Pedobacter terrae]